MAVYHPRTLVLGSGGALVNEVVHPHPCMVHAVHVTHATGTAGVIQIHNADSAPADGAVPLMVHQVAANSDAQIETLGWPIYFDTGLYICESTTIPTKTLDLTPKNFIYIIIETMTH